MKSFFTKKKIIWFSIFAIVVIAIVYRVFNSSENVDNILTDRVKQQTLKQTVLATGTVTSNTDLALSFKGGGVVSSVRVKVGSKVKQGEILAGLEQRDQLATLTQARGQLAQAKANLEKVLSGSSSEEVKVAEAAVSSAQVTLDNAKKNLEIIKSQQDVAVKNAKNALLNSTPEALANPTNISKPTVVVSGSYSGTEEGTYVLTIYNSGGGARFSVSGLESADGLVYAGVPSPIGQRGMYISFSTTSLYSGDSWSITLPNTRATNYVTNLNSYNSSLETRKSAIQTAESTVSSAQVSLDQAIANLALKKAQARPADVQVAQAQVLSAQGQVESATAALENTQIRAPADGTVTEVNVKVGEIAATTKEVIKLQDVNSLYVEANISEANIASLKVGQTVELTFDALGPESKFKGTLQAIDPASTVVSGVVNYKITAAIDKVEQVKPGMTANLTILVAEKPNILVVPSRSVLTKDGLKFVRVVTNSEKKIYEEVQVLTGLEGDGGLVEVINGLSKNQEIVTLIKK